MLGTRRGFYGGVYGTTYIGSTYYLNPDQFGYSTAQSWGSTTTTGSAGGDSSGGGGDGGGGSAGGGV